MMSPMATRPRIEPVMMPIFAPRVIIFFEWDPCEVVAVFVTVVFVDIEMVDDVLRDTPIAFASELAYSDGKDVMSFSSQYTIRGSHKAVPSERVFAL